MDCDDESWCGGCQPLLTGNLMTEHCLCQTETLLLFVLHKSTEMDIFAVILMVNII